MKETAPSRAQRHSLLILNHHHLWQNDTDDDPSDAPNLKNSLSLSPTAMNASELLANTLSPGAPPPPHTHPYRIHSSSKKMLRSAQMQSKNSRMLPGKTSSVSPPTFYPQSTITSFFFPFVNVACLHVDAVRRTR